MPRYSTPSPPEQSQPEQPEQPEQPVVLEVACTEPLFYRLDGVFGQPRADVIAARIPLEAWQRLSAGEGTKGPRRYDWVRVPVARLWLTPEERRFEQWLLVRRSLSAPTELAYYGVFAPTGTSLPPLVAVAGQRWRVEQSVELAKGEVGGEVGLDQYEVRRWVGWYRHITLAISRSPYHARHVRACLPDGPAGAAEPAGWSGRGKGGRQSERCGSARNWCR